MSKHYNVGLYLGRFQPLHVGHQIIIERMLRECERGIVAIGSAQENGTERNPLSYEFRKLLIEKTFQEYGDRLVIIPIYDRAQYSDDASWGDCLFKQVHEQSSILPDVVYEGDETTNKHWYDNFDIDVIKVPRDTLPISGTELREAIVEERNDYVINRLPIEVYKYYYKIRKEIQNAKIN